MWASQIPGGCAGVEQALLVTIGYFDAEDHMQARLGGSFPA